MLISVLNKHWRPLSKHEFWHEMTWSETLEHLKVSRIDEETFDMIFEDISKSSLKIKRRS